MIVSWAGADPAAPAADVFNFILFHGKFVFLIYNFTTWWWWWVVVAQGQGLHQDYAPHDAGRNADEERGEEV